MDGDDRSAEDVLRWAFDRFGTERLALVTSFSVDGSVLIDLAHRVNPAVRVITVDTGRMPPEYSEIAEAFRQRYDLRLEVRTPDSDRVAAMVAAHGPDLFYESLTNRLLCCGVRKVYPLQEALKGLDAWITGLRRDQWATRANLRQVEIDVDHGGITKISPLAGWTEEKVWAYVRENGVPVHPLYARGFSSISCAPCTRPVPEGQHPRHGRWWWEAREDPS